MKAFALARVLQLAERQIELQARAVKFAHGVWLRARGHQIRLVTLRDAHIVRLADELRGGVSADSLREKNRLQLAQAAERQAARREIDEAYREWQARLAEWIEFEKRVKALRLLEHRHLSHAALQNKRLEQRQHDELVALMHGPVAGTRQGR